MSRRPDLVFAILMAIALIEPRVAAAQRPEESDLAVCHDFARGEALSSVYVERAPLNPFPNRISRVAPWSGPVTGFRPPRPSEGPAKSQSTKTPATTGAFGSGGTSQEGASEPGLVDPRYREAFEACLRARGF